MKELSIEQKAERFDEALVRAKQALKEGTITNTAIAYIQDIFPELKESEDEKIRKALTEYFRWNHRGQLLNEYSNKDVLAWLEKQGEIEISFGAKDSELEESTYYIPKGFHAEINDDKVVIKKGEKPTEWSKEDEHEVAILEAYISAKDWSDKHIDRALGIIDNLVNKCKYLKNRVGCEADCTTTKEWDEEDLYMLEQAIKCVNNSGQLEVSTEEIEDWLKSLEIRMTNKQ